MTKRILICVVPYQPNEEYNELTFYFKMKPNSPLGDLKKNLEKYHGFPFDKQYLRKYEDIYEDIYDEEIYLDDNDRSISNYGIKDRSILKLMSNHLFVDLIIRTDKEDFLLEHVHCLFDDFFKIRNRIKEKIGYLYQQSVLLFDGRLIDSYNNLNDCGVKHKSIIVLGLDFKMQVFIKIGEEISGEDATKMILIECESTLIVMDFKSRIIGQLNQPSTYSAHFDLIFNGITLDDQKCLLVYDIQNESTLKMKRRSSIKLSINLYYADVSSCTISVALTNTIKDIKHQIKSKFKINLSNQQLIFRNNLLEDKKKILDYKLQDQSVILLFVVDSNSFPITIESKSARSHYLRPTLMVKPTDTITDIKFLIGSIENKVAEKRDIYLNCEKLDDKNQLKDYGITSKSRLTSKMWLNDAD